MRETTTGFQCCVRLGYCFGTSSSFPFSLYFCNLLFMGTLRCMCAGFEIGTKV